MKIDKEQIKETIKNLPAKIRQILKSIYNLPHSGKYFLLSFALLILFLVTTFPYDYLIKKKIYGLEGKSFRSIDFPVFDFSIFGETYIDNFTVVLNSGNELSCKHAIINVALNPVTLFMKNKLKSDFQFDLFKYSGKNYDFILNINGNIDLFFDTKKNLPKDGPVKIILSDSFIKPKNLSIPGPMGALTLNIESINIQSGNIDGLITNGILKFRNFKLTGNDIACDVSGTIDLLNNSKLDLTINIDSESSVLDQYKDILTPFIKNNILSLKIKGSTSNPEFALNNPAKNEN